MTKVGLLALDLDGVLLEDDSSWDIFHRLLGTTGGERDRNMEMFYSGNIDYDTWAKMDTDLWKGKKFDPVNKYLDELRITRGAHELVTKIRSLGVTTAIISTGISAIAEKVGKTLGIDHIKANEVEVFHGRITGRVRINCAFDEKGDVLRRVADDGSVPLEKCACVGDHENDISMFESVPFSIAYNPKSEKVAEKATLVIRGDSLDGVRRRLVDHFESIR